MITKKPNALLSLHHILWVFLVFSPCPSKSQDLTWVEGYTWRIEEGVKSEDSLLTFQQWYGPVGKLRKQTEYINGERTFCIITLFNEEEDKMKQVLCTLDSSFIKTVDFERDEYGEISKQINYTEQGHPSIILFQNEYNNKEQIIKSTLVPDTNSLGWKEKRPLPRGQIHFEYDDQGNLLHMTQFLDRQKIVEYCYQYDEQNNLTQEIQKDFRTEKAQTSKYKYDKQNRMIEEFFYYDEYLHSTVLQEWEGKIMVSKTITYAVDNSVDLTIFRVVE